MKKCSSINFVRIVNLSDARFSVILFNLPGSFSKKCFALRIV
jgi:hypothetical protein